MGVANLVSSGGLASAVKSVQRGVAVSSGNITISSVDVTKTQVTSFSTGAEGTVAASGAIAASTGNVVSSYWGSGGVTMNVNQGNGQAYFAGGAIYPANIPYESYFNGPFEQRGGRYGQTILGYYFNYATSSNTLSYVALNSSNITGGTTNLTSASYGAYLADATTLTVTGPCRYEIVEYY
jgi:hypothetical protein